MSEQAQSSTATSLPTITNTSNGGASPTNPPPANTSAPNTKAEIVVEDPAEDETSRRRRRRRRRRSLKEEGPEKKIRVFLLFLVIVLLIIAVSGAQLTPWIKNVINDIRPIAQSSGLTAFVKGILRTLLRIDVIALILAGMILFYMLPGNEEKIQRALGIKKDKRRR
jgi:hypothetical protein